MARSQAKSVRKLVSLSPELAERVEKFREAVGAPSESDALKTLIEDGLKLRDKPKDLFERLKNATSKGQSLSEVMNFLASDHPLIKTTMLDIDELNVFLNTPIDEHDIKFTYNRPNKKWEWYIKQGGYDNEWERLDHLIETGSLTPGEGVDDDIPF